MKAKVTDQKYGAKGDGVTDDTAAIQEAIIDAGVTHLVFPPGTYRLASRHSVNTGPCRHTKHPGNPNEQPYLWISRSNLHVDLGRATLLVEPTWSTSTPATATETFEPDPNDPTMKFARWRSTHASVFLVGYGTSVENVSITGGAIAGYGEKVQWFPANSMSERKLQALHEWELGRRADVSGIRVGPEVTGLEVRRVRMKDLYDGVQLVGAHDVKIDRCRFSDCHRQAVSITAATDALVANCHAEHCGYVVAQSPSPAWFAMTVSQPQRVGAYHIEPATDQYVHDVSFEHNTAGDCQHGFVVQRGGGSAARSVQRITMSDNFVHEGYGWGVVMRDVEGWSISRNRMNGGAGGMWVDNKCIGEAPSVGTIHGNDCFDAEGASNAYGIAVIWPNKEERPTGDPLHVTVSKNRCGSNAACGILLSEVVDATCEGNYCRSNGEHGVRANMGNRLPQDHSDLIVRGNTCVGNDADGIFLEGLRRACVVGNTCEVNDGYGIRALACDDTAIFKNHVGNNGKGDIATNQVL